MDKLQEDETEVSYVFENRVTAKVEGHDVQPICFAFDLPSLHPCWRKLSLRLLFRDLN